MGFKSGKAGEQPKSPRQQKAMHAGSLLCSSTEEEVGVVKLLRSDEGVTLPSNSSHGNGFVTQV